MSKKSSNSVKLNKKEMADVNSGNGGFSKKNSKDPNSNNSIRVRTAWENALSRQEGIKLKRRGLKVTEDKEKRKQAEFAYKKERDTKRDSDKLLKAQQRQAEYKQKRREYIGKSISGALESWKFKF